MHVHALKTWGWSGSQRCS